MILHNIFLFTTETPKLKKAGPTTVYYPDHNFETYLVTKKHQFVVVLIQGTFSNIKSTLKFVEDKNCKFFETENTKSEIKYKFLITHFHYILTSLILQFYLYYYIFILKAPLFFHWHIHHL